MVDYAEEDSLSSSELSQEEYVPNYTDEAESESSAEDDISRECDSQAKDIQNDKGKKRKLRKKTVKSQKRRRTTADESSSPDSSEVSVMTLQKKEGGGRLYNKKFYCLFCSKPFSKMARHLESKHKDKPEVARAITFPKASKERRIQLNLLRNRGNRAHNNQVLKEGIGMVIPRQQPKKSVTASDYMHCVNCEAYLKRKSLWRHMQRCHLHKKVSRTCAHMLSQFQMI